MSPLQLFRFVFFICSTFIGVSVAYALAYCPKPNGVALRTVAYQDLSPLFAELGTRFGSTEKFLVIAKVPPEIQLESRFVEIENKEARPLILKSPEFEEGAQSVAKDTGISIEAAREEFLKHLMKPRKTESSVSQNGLLYLYSNDLPTLKKFSSEIATDQGLVVEGTKDEIGKLLAGVEGKNSEWWRSNFSKEGL